MKKHIRTPLRYPVLGLVLEHLRALVSQSQNIQRKLWLFCFIL